MKDGGRLLSDEMVTVLYKTATEPTIYAHFDAALVAPRRISRRERLMARWYISRWPLVIAALRNKHECPEDDW